MLHFLLCLAALGVISVTLPNFTKGVSLLLVLVVVGLLLLMAFAVVDAYFPGFMTSPNFWRGAALVAAISAAVVAADKYFKSTYYLSRTPVEVSPAAPRWRFTLGARRDAICRAFFTVVWAVIWKITMLICACFAVLMVLAAVVTLLGLKPGDAAFWPTEGVVTLGMGYLYYRSYKGKRR